MTRTNVSAYFFLVAAASLVSAPAHPRQSKHRHTPATGCLAHIFDQSGLLLTVVLTTRLRLLTLAVMLSQYWHTNTVNTSVHCSYSKGCITVKPPFEADILPPLVLG